MKTRVLVILTTFVLALGMVAVSIALAQSAGQGQPDDEAQREAAMSAAAENAANANAQTAESNFEIVGPAIVTAPLFIGVTTAPFQPTWLIPLVA